MTSPADIRPDHPSGETATGREPLAATSIDQRESSFVLTYPPNSCTSRYVRGTSTGNHPAHRIISGAGGR